ncbi:WXG100 family type VII secretion target [Bifidobacterium adolescentis]|jgi:WXG100 family type VII secretion target|uniref:WXG100 family type VII secretion target n=1 Tax=Bifidobacterium TaxID=1678 RepID=UPI00189E0760|nr:MULTISPECIES: WXG100 family type VII secretion target [Bifidobacterium]MBM6747167.1 WXG100 family type VII secretion target [Bifidobacterium ruminantium]MDB0652356.1 WXG100 family type VII secretion target [Bifidobacterium adolescentis]MDB0654179.1 WXG100 family type VII secretion target [Bifidobacterium adolescentis]MDB0656078.1 WXG100 family type VII secretion target [Bifidobacterium adolescentis]MDB0659471.1 WXG100 family type VII secretion target [Bifidobacterium adolescentis]
MVSSFSVRPEQVDVLSSDIANDAKGIARELDNLDNQVKSLIEQWDGSAREAYHQAQRDWTSKLQEMNQILGQISQATSQIAQQYVESDARSAGRF